MAESSTSQNLPENPDAAWWTTNRSKAVRHVAEDMLTDEDIANDVGITRRTLTEWKRHPAFEAKRRELVEQMQERVRNEGLGRLDKRMAHYADRHARMTLLIAERGEEMADEVAGGTTGLLVRQYKSIGTGPNARQVEEYHVDTGLLRELREIEKQIAQDAGQFAERREISGPDGGPVPITTIAIAGSDEGAE